MGDINVNSTKSNIKKTLLDQNLQNWHSTLENSSKGVYYSLFKDNLKMENYLINLNKSYTIPLIKIRTRNNFLPIENESWSGIEVSDRKCTLCDTNDIGDEIHFILKCPFFEQERKRYITIEGLTYLNLKS